MAEKARADGNTMVGQLMLRTCRLVGERVRVKMEGIGFHKAQGFAVFYLAHHEGVPQSEIARSFGLSPASVTNMLQRMERDGWIERRPDPDDQRISRVYLTKQARALADEAAGMFHELEREVTSALTAAEQAELRAILLKVHARLLEHMPPGRHDIFSHLDTGGEEA